MGEVNTGKTAQSYEERGLNPDKGSIQQLRSWHKSMARAIVAGRRPQELSTIFGLSPGQVSAITGSPLFIAEVNRIEALAEYEAIDFRTELEIRGSLAIQAIEEGLLQGDADKAAKLGFELLDRIGVVKGAPVQKHLHLHAHKSVDDMSLEELQESAMELINPEEV
jgi:hypothetical protein